MKRRRFLFTRRAQSTPRFFTRAKACACDSLRRAKGCLIEKNDEKPRRRKNGQPSLAIFFVAVWSQARPNAACRPASLNDQIRDKRGRDAMRRGAPGAGRPRNGDKGLAQRLLLLWRANGRGALRGEQLDHAAADERQPSLGFGFRFLIGKTQGDFDAQVMLALVF